MVAALERALLKQTVVDGELVAFDDDGHPSFNVMQNAGLKRMLSSFFSTSSLNAAEM